MTIKVITDGLDDEATIRQVIRGLLDPDTTSVVIYKPGAYLHYDGKELMVDSRGRVVPAVHTGVRSEEEEPVGAC